MDSRRLFDAGKLNAAIEALGSELRDNPTDTQRRTFLFELLCFAGNHDRAEKQLDILASGGPDAGMGGLLYRSALHAAELGFHSIIPLLVCKGWQYRGCVTFHRSTLPASRLRLAAQGRFLLRL